MRKFLAFLLLLFAGMGANSVTAAPSSQRGNQVQMTANCNVSNLAMLFALPVAATTNFSDEVSSLTADDANRDVGQKLFTTTAAVSVPIPVPGSCSRPTNSTNNFSEDASVQSTATTQGSWQRVICDYNSVANSATCSNVQTTTWATMTFPDVGQTSCHLFSQMNSTSAKAG